MATTAAESGAKPRRLGWLRPPKMDHDGSMALMDHLREVRYRVTISAIAVVVTSIAASFFYRDLIGIVMRPYYSARAAVLAANPEAQLMVTNDGVIAPFTLAVIACVLAGLVAACPIWLYQVWAFIAPGLIAKEKKYALGFLGAAIPLFVMGCLLGYWIWPKGITVMLGFTPRGMEIVNMLEMTRFLAMEIRIILIFGLSFLLPVIIVALNLAGVVKSYHLARARRFVIFGSFVFAAIANPSTDPFTMLALAVPMSALYYVAELIARSVDKKRGTTAEVAAEFNIDVDDGR